MAVTVVSGTVEGVPAPMGSHRHIGRGRIINDNPRTAEWQNAVRWSFRQAYKGDAVRTPVSVKLEFCMPRPKSHYGTGKNATRVKNSAPSEYSCLGKPDLDKLVRAVLDCGTGILWVDDAQVVSISCSKRYSENSGLDYEINLGG